MTPFINAIVTHGDTIAVVVIALVYNLVQNPLRKKINADYKERNEQLERKLSEKETEFKQTVDSLTKAQNDTNIEMAKIKVQIEEKDKRIVELREDLQGRNPEMVKLLEQINESNKKIMEFMEMMHSDSKIAQTRQTQILEAQVRREHNIDTASADGSGSPMRTSTKGSK